MKESWGFQDRHVLISSFFLKKKNNIIPKAIIAPKNKRKTDCSTLDASKFLNTPEITGIKPKENPPRIAAE